MKYKIVVDKQSMLNPSFEKVEYEIDIEELRAKGDVCDSLVITAQETYVIRRLALSKYNVLSVLEEPIKEKIEDIDIILFEGDNYIYILNENGNYICAQYLTNNDLNNTFATKIEMNAAIKLSTNEINQHVEKKADKDTLTGAYFILKINEDTSEAKLNADKIELLANDILKIIAGNEINLETQKIKLKSSYLNTDELGRVKILAVGGSVDAFRVESNDAFTYVQPAGAGFVGTGRVDIQAQRAESDISYVEVVDENGRATLSSEGINQSSLEKYKKNFEKLELREAQEILNKTEIYKYNLKKEKNKSKKHIGFIIGKDYKYSKKITNKNNKGVDIYSMISVLYPVIQNQQKEIEGLKEEIKKLKEAQNNG